MEFTNGTRDASVGVRAGLGHKREGDTMYPGSGPQPGEVLTPARMNYAVVNRVLQGAPRAVFASFFDPL